MTFERPAALEINHARLAHLASLGLPLDGTCVLEVGAGTGLLGEFFEARGLAVTSTDGRTENVRAIRTRYPSRRAECLDLNRTGSHDKLGHFGVVFCYGALYHTADPALVLADLARVCGRMLLLETIVWHEDDGRVHPTGDNAALADQSLDGRGCRPARDWLWRELGRRFPFVYAARTQPAHVEFPLWWPVSQGNNARAVFVAANEELNLPTLAPYLPRVYARLSV
jgi:SAM-dependent methyltransferase